MHLGTIARRSTPASTVLAAAFLLAACGGSSPAATTVPATQPSATTAPAPTTAPSVAPTAPQATTAAPTAAGNVSEGWDGFADWATGDLTDINDEYSKLKTAAKNGNVAGTKAAATALDKILGPMLDYYHANAPDACYAAIYDHTGTFLGHIDSAVQAGKSGDLATVVSETKAADAMADAVTTDYGDAVDACG